MIILILCTLILFGVNALHTTVCCYAIGHFRFFIFFLLQRQAQRDRKKRKVLSFLMRFKRNGQAVTEIGVKHSKVWEPPHTPHLLRRVECVPLQECRRVHIKADMEP